MMNVPNEYHFIFALTSDSNSKPFSFVHFLAIVSCHAINRPTAINFYCKYEPSGLWWERAKPYLTVVRVQPPAEIFGNRLVRPEHIADVMRLQILLDKGGVYLDVDVLSLRSFAPLLPFETVLGEEKGVGLCNAVILARPGAKFLQRWMADYKSFNDEDWNSHSVRLPLKLAHENPGEIHVVDHRKFFWPSYQKEHLQAFFLHPGSQFCAESYCTHLWESLTWSFVKRLTPAYLFAVESEFTALMRRYVRPEWLCLDVDALVPHPSPAEAQRKLVALRALTTSLSPECREAVILCGLQRIPPQEAAIILARPERDLVSNFRQARKLLENSETLAGCQDMFGGPEFLFDQFLSTFSPS